MVITKVIYNARYTYITGWAEILATPSFQWPHFEDFVDNYRVARNSDKPTVISNDLIFKHFANTIG